MEKRHWIHKIHLPAWIVGILALVFVLRIPSFFEPYYYGDEMIYLTMGQGVNQGVTLYKDLHDNKPPLLYLTAAVSGNLFWFKAILTLWMGLTIVAFWKLSQVLFPKNERLQKVSTLVFAIFTTLPLLEGLTANAELFMIGLSIVAFYILLSKKLSLKNLLFAGSLFGLATLFKVPAAFDLPVIVVFWLITKGFKNWKEIFMHSFILGAGFLAPIFLTFIWYFFQGALPEYVKAAFMQNVGYLGSLRPTVDTPFWLRAFVVLIGSGILWVLRKRLSKNFILVCLWLIFSLFAAVLSQRPYPHYIVQSIAPISILAGMLVAQRTIEQAYTVIPLALALFVPVFYKYYHYPTGIYYQRFIQFATKQITKESYFNKFSPKVSRNYKIADFIVKSTHPSQKVFMWDPDSPAVYALSRRLPPIKFVADYHVFDFSSKSAVADSLIVNPPKFIILTSGHPIPELSLLIRSEYTFIAQIEDAQIWSKIDER